MLTFGIYVCFQYNAVDTSPLSNYVMHPFWNAFVKVGLLLLYVWCRLPVRYNNSSIYAQSSVLSI